MDKKEKPKTLVLIGAGLPRTGTTSTRAALQQLLQGTCYHMYMIEDQLEKGYDEQFNFWQGLQNGTIPCTAEVFHEFMVKHKIMAGVDHPFSHYYKELMQAFPKAKVLLTVRDPAKWYLSVKNTILMCAKDMRLDFPHSWYTKLRGKMEVYNMEYGVNPEMFEAVIQGEEAAVKFFNNWVEEVKRNVPEDRLLVFSLDQGWKPLCEFLNFPIPDNQFPHLNDTAAMIKRLEGYKKLGWWLFVCVIAVIAILAAFFIKLIGLNSLF